MGRLRIVVVVVLFLGVSAPAESKPLAVPPPPGGVTLYWDWCPDRSAPGPCSDPETGRIWLTPNGTGRFEFLHELGHVFDVRVLTDSQRAWFTPRLSASGPWASGPQEKFADAYAACGLGMRPDRGRWYLAYGYSPSWRTHRDICTAIRVLGLTSPGRRRGPAGSPGPGPVARTTD